MTSDGERKSADSRRGHNRNRRGWRFPCALTCNYLFARPPARRFSQLSTNHTSHSSLPFEPPNSLSRHLSFNCLSRYPSTNKYFSPYSSANESTDIQWCGNTFANLKNKSVDIDPKFFSSTVVRTTTDGPGHFFLICLASTPFRCIQRVSACGSDL